MAIIYTYPVKGTPLAADLLLISDTADGNKSKNATIASLVTSNAIDVVDTLNSLKGDINITGGSNITVTPSGQNIEISTSASNVDGSGTAGTIPKWSDSNTLTDSIIKDQGGVDILIPRFIKHDGDTDNLFGFNAVGEFLVSVDSTSDDQFSVDANAITMKTDSGTKLSAGPAQVALYNDENGSTAATKASLVTYDSGITVRGGTENAFSRGGGVRFFTSTNDGYVGIVGPTTNGTNYEVVLPNAVGTASQVLKLPSTIGTSPYQLEWGDAGGGITPTAEGGTGTAISSAALYNVLIGNGSSGASSAFGQSGDNETAIQLPVGTTARRPTANAANVGLIRYNSESAQFEGVVEDSVGSGTYSWVKLDVSA